MSRQYAYTCSYVPLEIIHAAGFVPLRLSGSPDCCLQEETDLSRNVCPYAHAILNDFRSRREDVEGVIVTDSCDAMKKVFDVLLLEGVPVHMISVPRKITEGAVHYFSGQLEDLYRKLCVQSKKKPDHHRVEEAAELYGELRKLMEECRQNNLLSSYAEYFSFRQEVYHADLAEGLARVRTLMDKQPAGKSRKEKGIPVITTGSPMPGEGIFAVIEETGFAIVENDSCLDARWEPPENRDSVLEDDPFRYLSQLYLNKNPVCPDGRAKKRAGEDGSPLS